MSVQLTVYPQWYNGVQSSITSIPSVEILSNPANFTAIGAGVNVTGAVSQTAQLAVNSLYSTMATNTWYGRVNSINGGIIGIMGQILFYPGYECILQKLGGVSSGALYDVNIVWNPITTVENVTVRIFNSTTLVSSVVVVPVNNEATIQFTAPSTNNTIFVIDYNNTSDETIIFSVSIIASEVQPPQPIQQLNNGSVICDLYEDEDIPLTLSVDNFKNAAEKVQSYSKAFNLPATKRNNQIFDNIFEITRYVEGGSILFNPLKRTKAVLKQDGFLIFEGFLRMLDISEKNGEISYNVNLYAEVTALADTLKDRTFQDLGFKELEHEYNRTNIELSWNNTGTGLTFTNPSISGFRNDTKTVKYPFVDWNHQMVVSDGTYNAAGNPQLTKLEQAFRPFIQIKYLVKRIFQDSQFSYTSTFFDTVIFEKLYMDFNWGADDNGAAPLRNDFIETDGNTADYFIDSQTFKKIKVLYTTGNNDLWDNTNYKFTSDVSNLEVTGSFRLQLENIATVIDHTARSRICVFNQYGVVIETIKAESKKIQGNGGSFGMNGSFSTTLQLGDYIQMQSHVLSTAAKTKIKMSDTTLSFLNITYQNEGAQVDTLLNSARADINQWEFLKGIMTMFNLIAIPDPNDINNLIIETYENIFIKSSNNNSVSLADRGITHNWTEKVDYSTMKISPLSDLKAKTIFKFVEDDDDYAFNIYKKDVQGHLYGSKVFDAVYSYDLTLLTGQDEVVAEPFAATVIKPLMSQYSDFVVPSVYAMSDDGETEGFANSPRIMYDSGLTTLSAHDYYIPAQNGVAGEILSNYLQFSHLSDTPPVSYDLDFNFGVCQLVPPWTPVTNNLFQLYWMPYYSELYNSNTRIVTVKINLNSGDINTFKFNDQIMIKNRAYRVNKIDYKPNDLATVELILLNYV